MKHKRRLYWTALLFIMSLLVSCRGGEGIIAPEPSLPTVLCDAFKLDSFEGNESILALSPPPAMTFFPNQLIVTGDKNDVQEVMQNVGTTIGTLTATITLTLPSEPATIITLYEISNGPGPITVATQINQAASAANPPLFAMAEPNYVIAEPKELGTEGAPGSSGIEGSPGSGGMQGPGISLQNFKDQWAFASTGWSQGTEGSYLEPGQQQLGTEIIVLDASSWATGSYFSGDLCVSSLLSDAGEAPLCSDNGDGLCMDKHGLFVASLTSAMSGGARVHQIQILKSADSDGSGSIRGSLFTLLGALLQLSMDGGYPIGAPAHTVINLSLAFEFDPSVEPDFLNAIRGFNDAGLEPRFFDNPGEPQDPNIIDRMKNEFNNQNASGAENVDLPVVSLELLLELLEEQGYVIVAAAGNHTQEMPQAPASYSTVIGVEAWNSENQLACFSNRADVAAPGGGDPAQVRGQLCQLDLNASCAGEPPCNLALTGHVDGQTPSEAQFGFWAGTSFATPLVSGLAVRIIETTANPLTPAEVRSVVDCTSSSAGQGTPAEIIESCISQISP
jgi:hypothetical protein